MREEGTLLRYRSDSEGDACVSTHCKICVSRMRKKDRGNVSPQVQFGWNSESALRSAWHAQTIARNGIGTTSVSRDNDAKAAWQQQLSHSFRTSFRSIAVPL